MKERKIAHTIAGNTITVTIAGHAIVICKEAFSEEDWDLLAFQGILVKIQRASAGSETADDADKRRLRKARELAEGQLNSTASRPNVQAIEKAVALRAAATMASAGVPAEVIMAAFPVLERAELEQMMRAARPAKAK